MSESILQHRPAGRRVVLRGLLVALFLAGWLAAAGAQADDAARLDLNRATAAELEALPGIGAVKAAAIVAERESSGGFRSMDDLESVRGIGPSLVARLRPHVTLGSSPKSVPDPAAKRGAKATGSGGR
jgi:competence ComEA-like helix-hairpin-helix protein